MFKTQTFSQPPPRGSLIVRQILKIITFSLIPPCLFSASLSEEFARRFVVLENPCQPIDSCNAKGAAIDLGICATMSDRVVANPLGHAGEVVVVRLALGLLASWGLISAI